MLEEKLNHETNEILLEKVIEEVKKRGVKLDEYCLRVNYQKTIAGAEHVLGHVIDESHLEPQPIYIASALWEEAAKLGLPVEEAIEIAIDHELIHEVHRSRAGKGLTFRFATDALESIIHGVQQRPEYLEAKKQRLSPKTIEWIQRKNQNARERHFTPMEQLSKAKIPVADMYRKIVEEINKEVSDNEYLEALGISAV